MISSLICEYRAAQPRLRQLFQVASLIASSYDGDDADPTPIAAEDVPEPRHAADEDFTKPEPESMPVIAGGSSGAADNADDSTFGTGHDTEGMEGVQDASDYHDSRAEERPIGIKEDG